MTDQIPILEDLETLERRVALYLKRARSAADSKDYDAVGVHFACAVHAAFTRRTVKPPKPRNKQPDLVRKAGPHRDRTKHTRKEKHRGN